MNLPKSTEQLRERFKNGEQFSFLYFWGHQHQAGSPINRTCLSQWYPSPFVLDGAAYPTAEHFMMAQKARLFGDLELVGEILATDDPAAAKALGRKVRNYDDALWAAERYTCVVRGNIAKFSQDRDLGRFLVATGMSILVEASPVDPIWGIGRAEGDPEAGNPNQWRGQNLLGFALMETREIISRDALDTAGGA